VNTPLKQLSTISANVETAMRATDFAKLAQAIMHNRGISGAAAAAELSSREGMLGPKLAGIIKAGALGISRDYLRKAAVTAGTLTGSPLADYSAISAGFVNSLISAAAFDALAADAVPVPFSPATVGAVTVGAQAYSLGEGSMKPISRLTITNQTMIPTKVHVAVVVTEELARSPLPGALQLIARELRNSVAGVTDLAFIAAISIGAPAATSFGSTGEAVRADIAALLRQVTTGNGSVLYLLVPPAVCKAWSMLTDQKGVSAFPDLGPMGGEINKIRVIASDGVPTGQAILVDASGIGAAPGEVALQTLREGSYQAESAPDSPTTAATVMTSMWQQNLTAVVVERWFCGVKLRSDAVATCTNANGWFGGNSPP
jgi:hypothetical protein